MSMKPIGWQELPATDLIGWPFRPSSNHDPDFVLKDYSQFDSALPVTVVTPSFNQAEFLEATIRSVLLQGHPNLYYSVVDGGSNDGSDKIIRKYSAWIDRVIIERDDGQSDAILKGIEGREKGWFNWINSDDYLTPEALVRLLDAKAVQSDLLTQDIRVIGDGPDYVMKNESLSAHAMLRDDRYSMAQPGLWFQLDRFWECGGIDRQFQYGFDWDLLVRYLATSPRIVSLRQTGAVFRVHENSKTASEGLRDQSENQFEVEHLKIRTKLESSLRSSLANSSRLGRRRRPWNQTLVKTVDNLERQPAALAFELIKQIPGDFRARFTWRTWGTIFRLISRYVRPKFWNKSESKSK